MGRISRQRPAVKLIAGFIFKQEKVFQEAKVIVEKYFGGIDFQSPPLNFTHTDYYEKEFGADLFKKIVSFQKLIPPQKLPEIKILTNKAEKRLSLQNKRRVNIDPGYLDLSKLVLASTKDYAHRIYLNKGIYGEVTLFYRNKTFAAWECTYPDYRTPQYLAIFNRIRQIYAAQVNSAHVPRLSRFLP